MTAALIIIFIVAYALIALEEPLGINKSAAALVGAGVLWTVFAMASGNPHGLDEQLSASLVSTAQVAFFLIGAMTIVEVIDSHDGFEIITSRLRARGLSSLVWLIAGTSFFLSAVLDNLTTAIIMVSLLRRLVSVREDRLMFAGLVILCANAGGAWSPIGDVTTTMLWIGGQVTSSAIITRLFLPSLVNALVPTLIIAWMFRGRVFALPEAAPAQSDTSQFERRLMFFLGLAALLAVPLFKMLTHLPPFMGILLGLGIVWMVGDLIHSRNPADESSRITIAESLTRIDLAAIVFFIGILLAVATLDHAGVLAGIGAWLNAHIGRIDVIIALIGLLSAVIDNVPMVAGVMGMFSLADHPTDSFLWEFLAYCAGTGGSILIIGSAAGVAAMGIERIGFLWYLRRFAPLALGGYVAGALVYLAEARLFS